MSTSLMNLSSIPANKGEQNMLASNCIKSILEGDISPLEAVCQLKSLGEVINATLKDKQVKEAVIAECEKYGKGEKPNYKGATIQIKEAAAKYDFSGCGDSVYNALVERQAVITEQVKEREKFLKTVTKKMTVVDDETGEICEILPPSRTSETTFAITFAK